MQVKRQRIDDARRRWALWSGLLVGVLLALSARAETAVPAASTVTAEAPDAKRPRMRLSSSQLDLAFQHIDGNRDGVLSRAETLIYPRVERYFDRADTNGDGVISPAEFAEAMQQAS